jgi:hypothetical protein
LLALPHVPPVSPLPPLELEYLLQPRKFAPKSKLYTKAITRELTKKKNTTTGA